MGRALTGWHRRSQSRFRGMAWGGGRIEGRTPSGTPREL